MKSKQRLFSIFSILLISFSTLFQPFTQIAFAESENKSESCDCIHMEKDVEGKATHEEDREKKFDFNLKFLIPKETADQSNKVIVSDVVDNRLTVHSASVVTKDGATIQGLNAIVDGQEVSLTLTNETKDKWNDKELHIQVVASINKEVADNEVIPNTFAIDLDGKKYTSNEVSIKAKEVVIVPVEPELPVIKKYINKNSTNSWFNFNEEFDYNVYVDVPTNLEAYETLSIIDELDKHLQIVGTSLFVEGDEVTNYSVEKNQQNIKVTFNRTQLEELKGKKVELRIRVYVKDSTARNTSIYNTAKVVTNGEKEVVSNRPTVRIRDFAVVNKSVVDGSNTEYVSGKWYVKDRSKPFEYEILVFFNKDYTNLDKIRIVDEIQSGAVRLDFLSFEAKLNGTDVSDYVKIVDDKLIAEFSGKEELEMLKNKTLTITLKAKYKDKFQYGESYGYAGLTATNDVHVYGIYQDKTVESGSAYADVYSEEALTSSKRVNEEHSKYYLKDLDEEFTYDIKFTNKKLDEFEFSDTITEELEVLEYKLTLDGKDVTDKLNLRTYNYGSYTNTSYEVKSSKFDGVDLKGKEFHLWFKVKVKDEYKDFTSLFNGLSINGSGYYNDVYVYPPKEEVPTPEPTPVSVSVQKVWEGKKQNNVTVELFADGKKVNQIVLSDSNNWKHTFADLDGSKTYTVKEVKVDGYETKITGNAKNGFVITNTEIVEPDPKPEEPKTDLPLVCECEVPTPPTPIEPATTSIDVEKVWKGEKQDAATINLLADGEKVDSVVLNDANKWKHTFTDLPVVNKVTDEQAIVYTVEEVAIDGYEVSIAGNAKEGFTVTNTENVPVTPIEPATTSVDVEKVWKGEKQESVTINLLADGKQVDSVVLNDANAWKHTFIDLPVVNKVTDEQAIVYTVEELAIDGYEVSIAGNAQTGFTVTNTEDIPVTPIEPAKTSVDVEKVWKGKKQDAVTINLLADGEKVDSVVLNDANAWKHTFTDLPTVHAVTDEQAIVYTVEEVAIDGYEVSIAGNAQTGFTVTNTENVPVTPIEPATTSVDVEKVWKGEKQDTVTINLLANGEKVDSVVLNDANAWKHTFTDLPVVNKVTDENAILYTVEEVAIDGYEVSIAGNAQTGYTVTNTEVVEPDPVDPEPQPEPKVCTDFTVTVNGDDVKEVNVVIKNAEGKVFSSGKTDKDGKFVTEKPLVVGQEYVVTVTKEGYEEVTKTVKGQEENCFTEIEMKKVKPVEPKPEEPKVCTDFTVETESNTKVTILDKEGNKFAEGQANEKGKFVTKDPLNIDGEYTVVVEKEGFKKVEKKVVGSEVNCATTIQLEKEPTKPTPEEPKVCDNFTVETEEGSFVTIIDANGNVIEEGEVDENGFFKTEKPLVPSEKYTVIVTKDGYEVSTKEVIGSTENCYVNVGIVKTPDPKPEPIEPEPVDPEEPKKDLPQMNTATKTLPIAIGLMMIVGAFFLRNRKEQSNE